MRENGGRWPGGSVSAAKDEGSNTFSGRDSFFVIAVKAFIKWFKEN